MSSVPLISKGEELNVEWLRNAIHVGGLGDWSSIEEIDLEKLSVATNAFGTLFRVRAKATATDAPNPGACFSFRRIQLFHAIEFVPCLFLVRFGSACGCARALDRVLVVSRIDSQQRVTDIEITTGD